jgi:hypothetical protein
MKFLRFILMLVVCTGAVDLWLVEHSCGAVDGFYRNRDQGRLILLDGFQYRGNRGPRPVYHPADGRHCTWFPSRGDGVESRTGQSIYTLQVYGADVGYLYDHGNLYGDFLRAAADIDSAQWNKPGKFVRELWDSMDTNINPGDIGSRGYD